MLATVVLLPLDFGDLVRNRSEGNVRRVMLIGIALFVIDDSPNQQLLFIGLGPFTSDHRFYVGSICALRAICRRRAALTEMYRNG